MDNLKSKYGTWALVTGASSGIGKEYASFLAKVGLNIVLVARSKQALDELALQLASQHKIQSMVIVADLSKIESVNTILQQTADLDIGILVNNAGYAITGDFCSTPIESQTDQAMVNSIVPMQLSYGFAQRMISKSKGAIINVASISAYMPLPAWAIYGASKAYLKSFSQALNWELKPKGIDVLVVCPGPITTNFQSRANIDVKGLAPSVVVDLTFKKLGKTSTAVVGFSNKLILMIFNLLPLKLKLSMGAKAVNDMKI